MILYIGADHRGFKLKGELKSFLEESGYTVSDVGNTVYDENDDYPDYAKQVAEKVTADIFERESKGILICGSGVGMDIVANRFSQIRSVLAFSPDHAMASRNEDDANVLSIPADFIGVEQAKKIVSAWLQTSFSGEERYKRRIKKTQDLGNSIN